MDAAQILSWSFGRAEAAALVGISTVQTSNYVRRYDLFPGRPRGKGHHVSFRLQELMKLRAVGLLIEAGLQPEQAASALRLTRGPFSAMRHDGFGPKTEPLFTYPGTMFFTRNENGHWVEVDSADRPICIQVRAWPIFDELWPRIRAQILKEAEATPDKYPGDAVAGVKAFEDYIEKLRAERWGEVRSA